MNLQKKRIFDGAVRYAGADKSDPFTFGRAMAHIRTGIAGISPRGEDQFYDADPALEERVTPTGARYMATVYRNVRRP